MHRVLTHSLSLVVAEATKPHSIKKVKTRHEFNRHTLLITLRIGLNSSEYSVEKHPDQRECCLKNFRDII